MWVEIPISADANHKHTLLDITDVDMSNKTNGNAMVYDSTTGKVKLQPLSGGGTINDGSITVEKTDFVTEYHGGNLFTPVKANSIFNTTVNSATGGTKTVTNWYSTDFIEVEPSTNYFTKYSGGEAAQFDKYKNYIAPFSWTASQKTTGATTHYIKVSMPLDQYDVYWIVKGIVYPTVVPEFFKYYQIEKLSVPTVQVKSKLKGLTMNCLGDSITAGQGTTKQYHSYIKDWAELGDVRNYGVSGRKLSGTGGMCEQYTTMDNNTDIVTVLGGINDANNGSLLLGDYSSRDINTFYGGLHALFSGLRAKYPTPNTRIIVFTLMQNNYPDPTNETIYARQKSFADATIEVARRYSIPCLDFFGSSEVPPLELHPDATIHEMMAKKMLNFIEMQF